MAAAGLLTRPERSGGQHALLTVAAIERHGQGRNAPGCRAAGKVEPARDGGARSRSARLQRSHLPSKDAHETQWSNPNPLRVRSASAAPWDRRHRLLLLPQQPSSWRLRLPVLKMAVSITQRVLQRAARYSLAPIRLLGLIRFLLWRPTGPLQSPIAP